MPPIKGQTDPIFKKERNFLCIFKELFEQEQRVKKGWFPANPKKKRQKGSAPQSKEEQGTEDL